ncbi:MAG: phosphatidylglycerophosphatase A [Candidatus Aminicenantales bacterium]
MKIITKVIATLFGVGYFPLAPGTAASGVVALGYQFLLARLRWPFHLLLVSLLFFAGVIFSGIYARTLKQKDPRKIVIDEACGQLLVLFQVPPNWGPVLFGFILFRLFDVVKPFPVRTAERLAGGWGIMTDDILAAVYSGLILHLYLLFK